MGEAAVAIPSGAGINPNVEVGAEKGGVNTGAGSSATFEDFERITDEIESEKKKKPKVEKVEAKAPAESKDKTEPKDAKKAKAVAAEVGDDGEIKDKADKPKPAPGFKNHKVRVGDKEMDLAGDATFTIPVNGEKVEVPLQDLVNDYNGKTEWRKRIADVGQKEKVFSEEKTKLNSLIKNVHDQALTDPDAAFDFLAEMTKKDPVELKHSMLKAQYDALLPVFEMDERERHAWFEDQRRNWRDKLHDRRTKSVQDTEKAEAQTRERAKVMQDYGLNEDRYSSAEKAVHDYLKKVDPDFDGKVTKDQVLYADRKFMAMDVIEEVLPNLVNDDRFELILGDIVTDLLRHPQLTPEKLAKQLTAIFGDDKKALKNVAKRVARSATASHAEEPSESRVRKNSEPMFFDDL